jgi:hypothetical protein
MKRVCWLGLLACVVVWGAQVGAQEAQLGAWQGPLAASEGEESEDVVEFKLKLWSWVVEGGMTQEEAAALCEGVAVWLHQAGCQWGAPRACQALGQVQGVGGLVCGGVVRGVCLLASEELSGWDAPKVCGMLGLGR